MQRKSSFPPIITSDARLLILGSLPGEASLAAGQYYAHPRNQFWLLMGEVLSIPLHELTYADKLATLQVSQIAIWDVIADAMRQGSLDSQIRDHRHNNLDTLIDQLPQLALVAFNGKTAGKQAKQVSARGLPTLILPSSSPALTISFETKLRQWLLLRDALRSPVASI
ncbi:DNA-deoxyinosine glycosylase [Chitinivorax sp. B]|uniref:DNA-deoxyinosine glycosylase n=1 Tax=Chitinivorax sp. B TaxID=2502235 RepID=UPI0010F4FE9F|nr:DNA-deoxyinosine glycosylase [Chitinivorax sp. B]